MPQEYLQQTMLCIAGVDAGNNNNVAFGANQVALDAKNKADQTNVGR